MRSTSTAAKALRAPGEAYPDFAATRPALYDAVVAREADPSFGTAGSPAEPRAAFGEFVAVVEPFAGDDAACAPITAGRASTCC